MSRNGKATATKRIMTVTAIVVILLTNPMEDDDDDDNVFIDDTACVIVCVVIFVIPDDAVSSCKWRWAAGLVPVAPSPCRCRYLHKCKA